MMDLATLIEAYLTHLQETGYSQATIQTNRDYMQYFRAFCIERGITHPQRIERPHIQRYQKYLFHYRKITGEPLSFDTQSQRLLGLKRFFSFLLEKGHIKKDPTLFMDLPHKSQKLPTVLTFPEVEKILSVLDITHPAGARDRALFELLFSTGMSRKEIKSLNVQDIDLSEELVTIRPCEERQGRTLPLTESAVLYLQNYILEVRPHLLSLSGQGQEEDTLFLDSKAGEPLHTWTFGQIIRRAKKRVGIQKKGGFSLFRGTVASLMIERGCDLRYVQEILGHKSPQTTRKFARLSIQRLKEVHTKTHPASQEEK